MKKHINLLFAIIGMLALAGCESPLSGAKNQVSNAGGAVVITLQTPQAANGARTIHPDLSSFTSYQLEFSPWFDSEHDPVMMDSSTTSIDLPVGYWTIIATAYSGEGEDEIAFAQGSADVDISSDVIASASITLGPFSSEPGTLNYSVTAPDDATGTLTVQTLSGGEVTGGTITLPVETDEDTLSLPAGEYLLFVSLTKGENHVGRMEVLHIYSGMTSEASYDFTKDDFISVETLAPAYAAFSNAVGAKALPSNTTDIDEAKGSNTAVFAIVGDGTDVATIDPSTGELTLVDTGEITVSLVITTASGVVTHMATSETITVTKLDPLNFTAPEPKTENGVTATVSFDPVAPQVAGTNVTASVTLSGTVGSAGKFTVDLSSTKASLVSNPKSNWLDAGAVATDAWTFSFTMPTEAVDDFTLTLSFVASAAPLTQAIIDSSTELATYITTNCAGGTEGDPKVIWFTGEITSDNLSTVRAAVNTAQTFVIWDLSEVTGSLTATEIGDTIDATSDTGRDRIEGLILPANLTTIEASAFSACSALTSITLPANLTTITSGDAFYGCSALTFTTNGGGWTTAEDGKMLMKGTMVVAYPSATGTVTLVGITHIGRGAFYGCTELTSITLPEILTTIEGNAFYGCNNSSFTKIILPAKLTLIGSFAFSNTKLTRVEFNGSQVVIDSSSFPYSTTTRSYLKVVYETGKTGSNKGVAGVYNYSYEEWKRAASF